MNLKTEPSPASAAGVIREDKAVRIRRYTLLLMVVSALIVLFALSRMRKKVVPAAGESGKAVVEQAATPVQLSAVTVGTLTDTLQVSGNVASLSEVTLNPKITARVISVNAREGDSVRRGQLLIALDTSDLDNQVRSAQAAVSAAQASLTNSQEALQAAKARAASAQVNLQWQRRTTNLAIQNAKESLTSAQAQYEIVRKGARSQERAQAQSAVSVARANLDEAQTNYTRNLNMYRQGAIAKSQVDTAETAVKVARAQLRSQQEQLSLVREGARPEELTQAQTAVAQARQGLNQAYANQQNVAMREEEYRAAQAAVDQARASVRQAEANVRQAQSQLSLARVNRSNAFIASPVNGIVATRSVEPGQVATTGTALLKITTPGTVYFSADVAERDVSKIHQGQTVAVQVDAYPNERFTGRVNRIYPTGNASSRTFTARITLPDAGGRLRPGMFARGEVQVERKQDVVMVPKAALTTAGSTVPLDAAPGVGSPATVFVMKDGKAAKKTIQVGAPSGNYVQVVSGLQPGDKVITAGSRLDEGDKVAVNS